MIQKPVPLLGARPSIRILSTLMGSVIESTTAIPEPRFILLSSLYALNTLVFTVPRRRTRVLPSSASRPFRLGAVFHCDRGNVKGEQGLRALKSTGEISGFMGPT